MTIHQYALSKVSCAGCVRSIEKALSAQPAIDEFAINFADRTATIASDLETEQVCQVIRDAGYGAELIEDENDFTKRSEQAARELSLTFRKAWLALGLGVLLMAQMLLGWMPPLISTAGLGYGLITALLTLYVMYHSGGHIYRGAWHSARNANFNMDTLIALGTGAAWLYSCALLMLIAIDPLWIPESAHHLYFEATVMILGFIMLGQALESRGRSQTASALQHLMNLQPKQALRVRDGEEREVAVQLLLPGDLVRIRPGQTVPVDAEIIEGSSYLDESMLTGESVAVHRTVGDRVTGGTRNDSGALLVRVTQVGHNTRLAQVMANVRDAQNAKPELGRLADRIAAVFVPVVMAIALVTALLWMLLGPEPRWSYALVASLTVLIVACPCALGLATPMAVMVGVGRAARMGVLIRNGDALQRARDLTTLVFDKTGTLTLGIPALHQRISSIDQVQIDPLAVSLARLSDHPLSKALVSELGQPDDRPVTEFSAVAGSGIRAKIADREYHLGNQQWVFDAGVDTSAWRDQARILAEQGCSLVWFADQQQVLALYGLRDPLREESAAALARLKAQGLKLVLLSGDDPVVAHAIAAEVGIDQVIAGIAPEAKRDEILRLQRAGEVVAMVGDGINDAPSLAQADVGYAMGAGTDVAIESADVVLMQNSLHAVANAISLSRATVRNIQQNLFGAFIYNSLAIPVAAGVLFPMTGLLLNPIIAGAAMALSSVTVVANARRLDRIRLR